MKSLHPSVRSSVCPASASSRRPKIKMRCTLFPCLAVPAMFVHGLRRGGVRSRTSSAAAADAAAAFFIHSLVHSSTRSFKYLLSRTSCITRTAVSYLFFSVAAPAHRSHAHTHTHTQHEACAHTHMHTHGAQGANHHRPLTGPVCEWEIFFFSVAPAVFPGSPSCPALF